MKRILFTASAIALALSAGSAFAADLPSRKEPPVYVPPPPPPPPLWTGLHGRSEHRRRPGPPAAATTAIRPTPTRPTRSAAPRPRRRHSEPFLPARRRDHRQ